MKVSPNVVNGNLRWGVIILLFFATTINYIDRQVIGVLKPYISGELGWSETGYSIIVTAFQIAYALGLLATGRLLDKLGTKIGYSIAIVLWSIACIAHASVRSVLGFSVVRFLLGLGEAANFPAAVKATAEWFPKKERAFATGIFNSGSTVGAIIAPLIVAFSYKIYGWEWAFIITGSLGFIWLLFWLLFYKLPSRHPRITKEELDHVLSDNEPETNEQIPWMKLIKHKQTLGICLSRFITDWVWWFFLFWTPDFLEKSFHINIKEQIIPLMIIYTMASLGGIIGGWSSSAMIGKGRSIDFSRKTTILVIALLVMPLILVTYLNNIWIAVGLIAIAAASHQAWAANIFTVVSDVYPKHAVGSMMGLSGFVGSIGGSVMAFSVGVILDATSSYFLIFAMASTAYFWAWLLLKTLVPLVSINFSSKQPERDTKKL